MLGPYMQAESPDPNWMQTRQRPKSFKANKRLNRTQGRTQRKIFAQFITHKHYSMNMRGEVRRLNPKPVDKKTRRLARRSNGR